MLRVLLFLATNMAVLVMAAIAMSVLTALGLIPQNAPYTQLLIWSALFGMGVVMTRALVARLAIHLEMASERNDPPIPNKALQISSCV